MCQSHGRLGGVDCALGKLLPRGVVAGSCTANGPENVGVGEFAQVALSLLEAEGFSLLVGECKSNGGSDDHGRDVK